MQNYGEAVMGLPDREWAIRTQAGTCCVCFIKYPEKMRDTLLSRKMPVVCSGTWFGFLVTFHSQPHTDKL